MNKRALVLKFGAAGDALRNTPLLSRLRREGYDQITWIADRSSIEVLSFATSIDRLVAYGPDAEKVVRDEAFETVFSLDEDPRATALAMTARSSDRRGYGQDADGKLKPLDARAAYAFRLGIDDELKFRTNRKTVPEIIFEMAGYRYEGEPYEFSIDRPPRISKQIALNIGVGPRWPSKAWPEENWRELATSLRAEGYRPLFLGGEAERETLSRLRDSLPPAPLAEFARVVASSEVLVTADTLGLHVGLGVKTYVVGIFCPTAAVEIEWFGTGEALAASKGPCYKPRCPHWPGCISEITPARVMERIGLRR